MAVPYAFLSADHHGGGGGERPGGGLSGGMVGGRIGSVAFGSVAFCGRIVVGRTGDIFKRRRRTTFFFFAEEPSRAFFAGVQVCVLLAWAGLMLKFWKNPAGPCGARTYLPTYLPYLWETKKEITRRVKVGYHTN